LTCLGLAKLLMAQKLAQFRGLCDKNIVSNYFGKIFENCIDEKKFYSRI